MTKAIVMIIILTSINVVALVFVFAEIGSPFEARLRELDSQRIQRLSLLKSQIDNYIYTNKRVPNSINDIKLSTGKETLLDPEDLTPFEYIPTNTTTYQLCAIFAVDSRENSTEYLVYSGSPFQTYTKGRYCFTFDDVLMINNK